MSGEITADERKWVVERLESSSGALLALVSPLSEAQWTYRPGPGRWTIAENVAHLTLVERSICKRLSRALEGDPNPEWETATRGKVEVLERWLLDRTTARDAPEPMRPGADLVKSDTLEAYRTTRDATTALARSTEAPLKSYTLDHPRPTYGTLNLYQWLVFVGLHNLRHNEQVEEVMGAAGFPRA